MKANCTTGTTARGSSKDEGRGRRGGGRGAWQRQFPSPLDAQASGLPFGSFAAAVVLVSTVLLTAGTLHARSMIVGNDEKTTWDDQGRQLFFPGQAKDNVCIVDIASDPLSPKIVATLPLENSVYGPPTNLAITPDEKLAFVANPVKLTEKDDQPAVVPDNRLHVIDLEGTPRHLATIEVGQQPSGMDVSPNGRLLLIANRAQNSLSVLGIEGKSVRVSGRKVADTGKTLKLPGQPGAMRSPR